MFGNFDPYQMIMYAAVMLIALPVHECAHAVMAYKLGDPTAKNMGRITLNPLKHLDLIGSICMILMGFGWAKPVMINPLNFKNRRIGMATSSLAGPLSNFFMAFIGLALTKIFFLIFPLIVVNKFGAIVFSFLTTFVYVNIILCVFNLLPIPPLDGSRIIGYFMPDHTYSRWMELEYKFGIFLYFFLFLIIRTPPVQKIIAWGVFGLYRLFDIATPLLG